MVCLNAWFWLSGRCAINPLNKQVVSSQFNHYSDSRLWYSIMTSSLCLIDDMIYQATYSNVHNENGNEELNYNWFWCWQYRWTSSSKQVYFYKSVQYGSFNVHESLLGLSPLMFIGHLLLTFRVRCRNLWMTCSRLFSVQCTEAARFL